VSTGCASAGRVSVVQEPLGFPATGNVPDPASLGVPLEAPESPAPLPELPPLVGPELAPLDPAPLDPAPLDDPLEVLGPSMASPPSSPPPEPPPELDASWPEALVAWEPVPLLHPIPSATERENESKARRARIVVLPSKCLA
jgi:hypothetical protein